MSFKFNIHETSIWLIKVCLMASICLYLFAALLTLWEGDPFYLIYIHFIQRKAIETAPSFLGVGVICGLILDLYIKDQRSNR